MIIHADNPQGAIDGISLWDGKTPLKIYCATPDTVEAACNALGPLMGTDIEPATIIGKQDDTTDTSLRA